MKIERVLPRALPLIRIGKPRADETRCAPRFSSVLYMIESKLHELDCLAAARGVALTDSAIRSLLVRCINEANGKTSKSSTGVAASGKDRFLAEAS